MTSRSNGKGYAWMKLHLTCYIRGWLTYYRYADMKTFIISANKWYNRRLRILANIQQLDIDTFHYQRTADIGRVSVNPESLHQVASQLREPPYAERHVRWCERSENESRKKTTSFSSYSIEKMEMNIKNIFYHFQKSSSFCPYFLHSSRSKMYFCSISFSL